MTRKTDPRPALRGEKKKREQQVWFGLVLLDAINQSCSSNSLELALEEELLTHNQL